ncbi:putative aminopeptidase YsdC [Caloramator mitchellensis]|uniref:Putative aminopeptidase YsdC n=1 Tax=Caloramator mitchellensis TaxID=908809 RepID=A0A0R3JWL4_CALMK|nr:M42 family metallopeptidase [Caloramator mitchellensis]KRQ87945.1 putative aminopeptidase YsdC [Caloramator mitchellensis]
MLKRLTDAFGVSGCEKEVREVIKEEIKDFGEVTIDKLGNLILHKKGKGKRVMLAAHMDEVGFIVTGIKEDGRIKFAPVGGIDARILVSKRVVFERTKTKGIIGYKPIHLQNDAERNNPVNVKELFVDIGATSKDEALKYVKLGDYATFESQYIEMGNYIKAKALDDRVGCAILMEVLKEDYDFDIYFVWTVQEEVGLRGATVAAYSIEPEIGLVIEGTTCADFVKDEKDFVTETGKGPAISVMDSSSIADEKLLNRIVDVAEENNIPIQFRRGNVGGNDAGIIHKTKKGAITASISVPTKYIHSPISMIHREDYKNTLKLVKALLRDIEREDL